MLFPVNWSTSSEQLGDWLCRGSYRDVRRDSGELREDLRQLETNATIYRAFSSALCVA